jgi:hypothetical protein
VGGQHRRRRVQHPRERAGRKQQHGRLGRDRRPVRQPADSIRTYGLRKPEAVRVADTKPDRVGWAEGYSQNNTQSQKDSELHTDCERCA